LGPLAFVFCLAELFDFGIEMAKKTVNGDFDQKERINRPRPPFLDKKEADTPAKVANPVMATLKEQKDSIPMQKPAPGKRHFSQTPV
jgi:hypothetical protein